MVHALPREIVQPALPVMQVPERDAGDDVIILPEESEELGVLLGLAGEDLGRAGVGVRIDLRHLGAVLVIVSPPATTRDDVDIELADHDLHADATQGHRRRLDRIQGRVIRDSTQPSGRERRLR